MGFVEYAWALSFQKDNLKTKILLTPELQRPTFVLNKAGYDIAIPEPSASETNIISFLGFEFPTDASGKAQIGRLFRACISHLTAHTMIPDYNRRSRNRAMYHASLEAFVESLVDDAYVVNYVSSEHADRLFDVAFANSLAFTRVRSTERIFNPATRLMSALLMRFNTGMTKGALSAEEEATVEKGLLTLDLLKRKIVSPKIREKNELGIVLEDAADALVELLSQYGPVVEAPSMPHTEYIGPCKTFDEPQTLSELETQRVLLKSLETMSGKPCDSSSFESENKQFDSEATQAFDTWLHQRVREEKILIRLRECAGSSRFKSIRFPELDYPQYLRARSLVSGGSRRLLDSLRVAQDAMDEDPGKEFGQLDLTAVINAIASKKPATDVFMRDEYLSRSFALGLLFDASKSMKIKGEYARALAICVVEATKELLMDPGSWTFFAFNDSFWVLKDASEPYSTKVRARMGGLRFGGLTYLPDAIRVTGEVLARRYDEQRFLIVISDGWPYGYSGIEAEVSEAIDSLQKKGVIVIGIGVETDKMKDFFKLNAPVYTQKDLIRRFSTIFLKSSASALEA